MKKRRHTKDPAKESAKEPAKEPQPGSLELKVYFGEYATFVALGVPAAIPVTTWVMMIALPFGGEIPGSGGGPSSPLVMGLLIALALFMMFVAPSLVPILVLRARQARGARIEWDAVGVTEWDGPWRRAFIPWSELSAGRVTWETQLKNRTVIDEALQLVGPPPTAAITVWTEPPRGVPKFRRRLRAEAARVAALREAIEQHGIALTRAPDWLLACDSDRPPHRALTIAGRFGYPLAVIGPIVMPSSHAIGFAMGVLAAVLLGVRAAPSLREIRAIVARDLERTRARVARRDERSEPAAASDEPAPYRAPGTLPSEELPAPEAAPSPDADADAGRAVADRLKLRAAIAEAVVRMACVVLAAWSTVASFLFLH